jgi:hypothetical protein
MFGSACVNPLIRGDKLTMQVDKIPITIDLSTKVRLFFLLI